MPDGTITSIDHRRNQWQTINAKGVIRVRKVKDRSFMDERVHLKTNTSIDPETSAKVHIRSDGLLRIEYLNGSLLVIFPDGT